MATIKQMAQQAIDVQDASNLSGVVRSWAEVISALRELGHGRDHAINKLWASKVHDLCDMGLSDSEEFGKAYRECKALAK